MIFPRTRSPDASAAESAGRLDAYLARTPRPAHTALAAVLVLLLAMAALAYAVRVELMVPAWGTVGSLPDGTLVVEATVERVYGARLDVGQAAFVRFDAFDLQGLGEVPAAVAGIVPHTILDPRRRPLGYRVVLRLDRSIERRLPPGRRLRTGMDAQIRIGTQKERLFNLLFFRRRTRS